MSAEPSIPEPFPASSRARDLLCAHERIAELEAELRGLRDALVRVESMRAEDHLALEEAQAVRAWRENQNADLERDVAALTDALAHERTATEELEVLRARLQAATAEATRARSVADGLESSLSWRLTSPARAMLAGARRLRHGRRGGSLPPGDA
jgi:chromosome segregation ATPase